MTKLIHEEPVRGDLGYHSLETDNPNPNPNPNQTMSEAESKDMRRSIDETIAFLNQTIEDICCADADLYTPFSTPEPQPGNLT